MNRYPLIIICSILVLTSLISFAQRDNLHKGVAVSGSSRIFSQLSSRQGTYQEIPRNFAQWELNNTFNFSGIPVVTSLFLSTEESSTRQNITGFRVGLDARAIARSKLYEKFRFLSLFPTLEAGNCRPVYSPFTLSGVNLRGVNVEFNPGHFYMAFATGRLVRAVRSAEPQYQTYERNLTFGRIGVGKTRQSYFALTLLHARDDPESVRPDPYRFRSDPDTLVYHAETFVHGYDSGYLYVMPKENYVAGAELNVSLFKKKLTFNGEMAGSLATVNQNAFGLIFEEIPERFREVLFFNSGSRIDYAWAIRSGLKLKNTDVSCSAKYIGPGFVSLGTAYLRADVNQFDGKIVQFLDRKKIRFQAFFKSSRDNVINWKSKTTQFVNWGINASFRYPEAPWFTLLFSPYRSFCNMENKKVRYDASDLSLTSGYQFRSGKTSSFTSAMVSFQNGSNNLETGDTQMTNLNLMISETLTPGIPFSFSGGMSYNDLGTSLAEREIISCNGKVTFRGIKWLQTNLGISHTWWKKEMDRNRLSLSILVNMGKFGTFTLDADRNSFANHVTTGKNYSEYILRMAFAHRW